MAKRVKTNIKNVVRYPNGRLYYLKGNIELSLDTTNEVEAEEAKAAIEGLLSLYGTRAFKLRIRSLFPKYLEQRRAELEGKSRSRKKIRQSTFDEIESLWDRHLEKAFGAKKLIDINEVAWNKYVLRAKVSDLANHRKVMTGFLSYCKQQGLIKYLPDFKIPKVNRRKRRILSTAEIELLFTNSTFKLLLYNSMYLFMAMRNIEIVKLEWNRVNFAENYLYLREMDVKTNKPRAIPLNPHVRDLLLKMKNTQQETGLRSPFVFPMRGNPKKATISTGLRKSWETATALCKWKVGYATPHDLRATYKHYSNKRADFTDAQREKFAGASITVQKNIYVDFHPDDLRGLENVVDVPNLGKIIKEISCGYGKLLGET